MYIAIPSTAYAWNTSHCRKNWAKDDYKGTKVLIYRNLYSCHILMTLGVLKFFFLKSTQYTSISNFMKIRPVEAELFHADGRIDRQVWRS